MTRQQKRAELRAWRKKTNQLVKAGLIGPKPAKKPVFQKVTDFLKGLRGHNVRSKQTSI